MGVRYSVADSALLIQALTNNITTANQVSDRLASGCEHLMSALDSGELQGVAYTAGRGLFSDIIIPSIKKLQEAIDDIQAELTSYIAADGVVSEFGSLDLDQLKQIKELRYKQWENVSNQIAENQSFSSQAGALLSGKLANLWQETFALQEILNNIEDHIRELDDKIEKLQWFVGQVSRLFTDSLTVLNLAIKGASQLSQVIVDSNGGYSVQGLDMSWVEQMKNEKIETYQSDKYTPATKAEKDKKHIVESYVESYKFDNEDGEKTLDKETALLLYKLQQGILKRAEKEGWSKERIIYEYNRIVASPVYGERAAWRGLAGTLDPKEGEEFNRILATYSFSKNDINHFKIKIIEQHKNSNNKDLAHEAIQMATFTEEAWNEKRDLSVYSDGKIKFGKGWKEVMSHILSTSGNQIPGEAPIFTEKYESSFKGDIDSTRYSDSDFNSDLDAISIYERMRADSVKPNDIFKIQATYNNGIRSNEINRVQEFYTNMGNGDVKNGQKLVKYIVETDTVGGGYIKHDGKVLDIITGKKTDTEDKAKGDFYNYLERGANKNVGT